MISRNLGLIRIAKLSYNLASSLFQGGGGVANAILWEDGTEVLWEDGNYIQWEG